jgi:hypothetical protein
MHGQAAEVNNFTHWPIGRLVWQKSLTEKLGTIRAAKVRYQDRAVRDVKPKVPARNIWIGDVNLVLTRPSKEKTPLRQKLTVNLLPTFLNPDFVHHPASLGETLPLDTVTTCLLDIGR